jgi:hypothetical protein
MVKARFAPAIELLEAVVRDPRPASSGTPSPLAISWKESRDDACGGAPGKLCPRQGIVERQALPFTLYREEEVKASPPCEEGSLQEKVSPLAGRKWCTREGS